MPEDDKLFYTIGEVAQWVGVKPYVLRYWETEFRKLNPEKSVTGQRTYRKRDIQIALTIKRLLYAEQYTIAGALKKLEELEEKGLLDSWPSEGNEKSESLAPKTSRPTFSPEKVMELKNLIAATHAILKKYNLT